MDIRMSLDGGAGMLLLSLPWLMLAAVARRAGRFDTTRGRDRVRRDELGDAGQPTSADVSAVAASETFAMMSVAAPISERSMGGVVEADVAAADSPPSSRSWRQEEEALVLAVSTAKSERNDAGLARNSVLLARVLLERSARAEAATLLQSAALIARRAKLPVEHAEARIELAEMARADGDMTSACEHWQMAKLMFHETGRRADRDRMADFMRQHHCPTDWVLTNF